MINDKENLNLLKLNGQLHPGARWCVFSSFTKSVKEGLLRCAHIANIYIFNEIEHHRIKPCRLGLSFFSFLFFLAFFLFFTSGIYTHTLPPQNHRQNALAMLYSKGSAPKKKRGKKRKNSLDPPSPHIPPTSPLWTFMSNANERKFQGSVAPSLRTDSSFSSSSSSITTP